MPQWTPRDVKDMIVPYPNRYKLDGKQVTIEPDFGTPTQAGTPINKAYLQPIENRLVETVDRTTAPLAYYVSPSGSNNNDGLSADKPFKTIQKAIDTLPQIINHTVEIIVAQGTYTENVKCVGFSGGGRLSIRGYSSATPNIVGKVLVPGVSVYTEILFLNFSANSTERSRFAFIDADGVSNLFINSCNFNASGLTNLTNMLDVIGVGAYNNSSVYLHVCTFNNFLYSFTDTKGMVKTIGTTIQADDNSFVFSNGSSGTNNRVALESSTGCTIIKNGTQPSATTAEKTAYGGVIK